MAGVPRYQVSQLELGKTQAPSFEDLVRLGKALDNLSPNEVAALMGLWAEPEADEDNFVKPLALTFQRLRQYALTLSDDEQVYLSGVLEGALEVAHIRQKDYDASTVPLPEWFKRRRLPRDPAAT
jgi:transcriptional regulator with XRE-family HTH domain